jgi:hypothetical protein
VLAEEGRCRPVAFDSPAADDATSPLLRPLLPTMVDISILKQSPRVDAACRGRSTAPVITMVALQSH